MQVADEGNLSNPSHLTAASALMLAHWLAALTVVHSGASDADRAACRQGSTASGISIHHRSLQALVLATKVGMQGSRGSVQCWNARPPCPGLHTAERHSPTAPAMPLTAITPKIKSRGAFMV